MPEFAYQHWSGTTVSEMKYMQICKKKQKNNHPTKTKKQCFTNMYAIPVKGIFSDSNNIFLWHESEDINWKSLNPKFQLIPSLRFQVMHDYVCFIAPIDNCVK